MYISYVCAYLYIDIIPIIPIIIYLSISQYVYKMLNKTNSFCFQLLLTWFSWHPKETNLEIYNVSLHCDKQLKASHCYNTIRVHGSFICTSKNNSCQYIT